MRVLQINALGRTLSNGRTTREMHDFFLENGIESYIATARNADCDDAYAISTLDASHIHTALSMVTGLDLYFSKKQTAELIRWIDEIRPDVVHLRILHSKFLHLGMLLEYLAAKDICTVITLHDMWYLTAFCCHYLPFQCDRWQTGCHNCPAVKADKRRPLFDRTRRMWNDKKKWFSAIPRLAVIGNSMWTTQEAEKSFLRNSAILKCIYNWIDFSVFYPRDASARRHEMGLDGKKIILGVSALWGVGDNKGFDDFLRLATELPDEYVIILIGSFNVLRSMPDNMIMLPRTNDTDELAEFYSIADVFVNLSRMETFGKVTAEAVSCGTPVVVLNNTANPELVPEGAGVVIDEPTPQAILSAVQMLCIKPKEDYQSVCLDFAKQYFDKETNIEEYLDVYHRLINMKEQRKRK